MPNNVTYPMIHFSSGDPETVDDVSPRYPGQVGAEVTIKQPGPPGSPSGENYREKTYKYVQTDSSMAVAPFPGAVAWWAHATNYLATTDSTKLGRNRVAGLFQGSPKAGNYCFIQTKGPGKVKFIDAVTSAPDATGKPVVPSTTAGKADCLAVGAAAAAGLALLGVSAGVLDGGTSEAVVELDVPHNRP